MLFRTRVIMRCITSLLLWLYNCFPFHTFHNLFTRTVHFHTHFKGLPRQLQTFATHFTSFVHLYYLLLPFTMIYTIRIPLTDFLATFSLPFHNLFPNLFTSIHNPFAPFITIFQLFHTYHSIPYPTISQPFHNLL